MQEIAEALGMKCFNTSHVVVYLRNWLDKAISKNSFNTSHVVVYRKKGMDITRICLRFNTSHVVVYPYLPFNKIPLEMFQYISCCSLSYSECLHAYTYE